MENKPNLKIVHEKQIIWKVIPEHTTRDKQYFPETVKPYCVTDDGYVKPVLTFYNNPETRTQVIYVVAE